MTRERLVPLIVAVALFMENMDSTVIATSLPAIAADIGANPLALKLAITSYLLALAIFIPGSGWTADRFGARTIFRAAIAVFMVGSIGCALAESLNHFVIARFLQGMGGAMMAPVGRLVLLRSVDKRSLVEAMTWLTMPALIGPLLGPPLGGFITTYLSWHWIFLINLPIGLLGIVLATKYIEDVRGEEREPFDAVGIVLAGLGIGGLAFGLTAVGLNNFLPPSVLVAMVLGGAAFLFAYVLHARRTPAPVMDLSLLALPTFRAGVVGGFVFRVGAGALPFLLPLMLQVGFHKTPLESGLITFARDSRARHARGAVRRRLLPLAPVHQRDDDRLRRGRAAPHEPRHLARERVAAAFGLDRRRARRAGGRGGARLAARDHHRPDRFRARVRAGGLHRGAVRIRLCAHAEGRRLPADRPPARSARTGRSAVRVRRRGAATNRLMKWARKRAIGLQPRCSAGAGKRRNFCRSGP